MKLFPGRYDALELTTMASGHLCLNLSETVSWEGFPAYARTIVNALGGKVLRESDAVDIRLWDVEIEGHRLQLVFDDFPVMVSLESPDALGDALLRRIYERLATL